MCVFRDTVLETEEGFKRAELVTTKDKVLSEGGEFRQVVRQEFLKEQEPMMIITTTDGRSIVCSHEHQMANFVNENTYEWIPAKYLNRNFHTLTIGEGGKYRPVEIATIEPFYDVPAIDIEVEGTQSFLVDGLISHI